jgi:hypothetical protein
MVWNSPFVGKITGHFSPIGVSRVAVDVGASGGTSGNFQSQGKYNKPIWLQYNRRRRRRRRRRIRRSPGNHWAPDPSRKF